MTKFLINLFIKNNNQVEDTKVRSSYGILASLVGIFCNTLLFLLKITIGMLINSISITADAFNNLSDAGSSIISFIGVKLAGKPADKEHPFGHGRMEYISALIVAFVILDVGFRLFQDSLQKVLHPEQLGFNWIMIILLAISVLVKLWLSVFYTKIGTRINSSILKATSADSRNDVVVTTTTIISVLFTKITGYNIDGWMGMIVSVFVLFAGFNIAKDTLMPLLGEAVDRELYENITKKVESYQGIIGSHDLIIHNYGPSHIMATIHTEVPNNSNIDDIHEIIDKVERDILRELGIFIVIHMDPVEISNVKVLEEKKLVQKVVKDYDENVQIHDFHVIKQFESVQLVFDLVVPYSYNKAEKEKFREKVVEEVRAVNSNYECIITVENSFVAE